MNIQLILIRPFGLLYLLFTGLAFGQDSNTVQLEPLIKEALLNNPGLASIQFEAEAAQHQIAPAGAYEDPIFGFEAMSYPRDTLSSREFGMTGNRMSLTQAIPFPGKKTQLQKVATEMYESKHFRYQSARLELIRVLKLTYFDLYFAYKTRDILMEQQGVVRQLIPIARSRYTLGKISQAAVLGLQVEEADLLDQMLKSDREIAVNVGNLNHILGREQHHALGGKPILPSKTKLNFEKITEERITKAVLKKSPNLNSYNSEVESSKAQLSYAKLNYFPNFEFNAAYTQRNPNPGDRGVDFVSAGIGISLPIWAINKQSKEIKAARAEQSRAQATLQEERLHQRHLVHTLYAELEEAAKRVKLYSGGLLPLAQQSVTSAQSAFLTGQFEYASLLDLIRKRFGVELAFAKALTQYESKIVELEALSGVSLEELENDSSK
ncbi:MAG: TolC family protein [Bdellovibrionales bacterium]|nr:TolC family protein [Bdellovibrionales bacterium]